MSDYQLGFEAGLALEAHPDQPMSAAWWKGYDDAITMRCA